MVHVSMREHPKNEDLLESLTEIVSVCTNKICAGVMGQNYKKKLDHFFENEDYDQTEISNNFGFGGAAGCQ